MSILFEDRHAFLFLYRGMLHVNLHKSMPWSTLLLKFVCCIHCWIGKDVKFSKHYKTQQNILASHGKELTVKNFFENLNNMTFLSNQIAVKTFQTKTFVYRQCRGWTERYKMLMFCCGLIEKCQRWILHCNMRLCKCSLGLYVHL